MTAHQRRPGFRLPWSAEGAMDDAGSGDESTGHTGSGSTEPAAAATPKPAEGQSPVGPAATEATAPVQAPTVESGSSDEMGEHAAAASATAAAEAPETPAETAAPATSPADTEPAKDEQPPAQQPPADTSASGAAAQAPSSTGFLGELLTAMRRVADETRQASLAELRQRAEKAIRENEADAERRRGELRTQAEADIAGVGDWAKAEAERIKAEAEQRVAARRAQMDEQINAETSRVEAASAALRARVAGYERELEAYHVQLATIGDPAAFAEAATRMPPAPALDGSEPEPAPQPEVAPAPPQATEAAAPGTNGSAPTVPVADAEGHELDAAELQPVDSAADVTSPEHETLAEPLATEIVVKGLGSFGAITGFRQQLAAVEGIDAVGLSLGTSGEFVFRATHRPSLDMSAAITSLEGDAVHIEPRPEGGLRVTLGKPR